MQVYLEALSGWDWMGLAIVLLILEVFDAGGYLLWVATIAASLGLLQLAFPLPWVAQIALFVSLSALAVLLWQRRRRLLDRS